MRCFISTGHGVKEDGKTYDPGNVFGVVGGEKAEEHVLAGLVAQKMAMALAEVEPHVVPRAYRKRRIDYVNRWSKPGDIAIEVHMNSAANEGAKGCEVFYAPSSSKGHALAVLLHARLVTIGRQGRGAKPDSESQWSSLEWCRRTKPWAVLVEVGFLSNQDDRTWLMGEGTSSAAVALALAVDGWA